MKSWINRPEKALLQALQESLGVEREEVLAILLRVVAHGVAREAFPLSQMLSIAKSSTDDDLAMLTHILQAINLSKV